MFDWILKHLWRFALASHYYNENSLSMKLILSQWGGLSTKKFQPKCVNEESLTERRS